MPFHERDATKSVSSGLGIAKEFGTVLVLWASIVGYVILGAYFRHVHQPIGDLASLGTLAPVAFGMGLLLLGAVLVITLLPAGTLATWRLLMKTQFPGQSARHLNDLTIGTIVLSLLTPMFFVLGQALGSATDPRVSLIGFGCGILTALMSGFFVLNVLNAPDPWERIGISSFLAATSPTPLMFLAQIAWRSPNQWMNSWQGVTVFVAVSLVVAIINSLLASGTSWDWIRPRWKVVLSVLLITLVFVIPSALQQDAWLATRVVTMAGLRTDDDVGLWLTPEAAQQVRLGVGPCAELVEEDLAGARRTHLQAQLILKTGSTWTLEVPLPAACFVPTPKENVRRQVRVDSHGVEEDRDQAECGRKPKF